jgi:cell fate regulator YaaT (PSP1 superfamily)
MANIVGVKFDNDSNVYYFNNKGLKVKVNITVIANTSRGLQFGKIVSVLNDKKLDVDNSNELIRISSKKDYLQYLSNVKDAKLAIIKCKQLISELGLSMSIIDANYNFDRSQLLFRFIAESRVDFRQLARELGSLFKTRIELRQIGIRDKAKEVGGLGPCGRKLCCSSFLNEFDSVSINMAKNQSLSLNPSKINGVCGRLLCCLKYENEDYLKGSSNLSSNKKFNDKADNNYDSKE